MGTLNPTHSLSLSPSVCLSAMRRNDCTYRQIVTPFGKAVILIFLNPSAVTKIPKLVLSVLKRGGGKTRRLATAKNRASVSVSQKF